MARRRRSGGKPDSRSGLLAPSIVNMVIADIVLRGAGTLVQRRLDSSALMGPGPGPRLGREDVVRQLLEERSLLTAVAVAGATRLAARSPAGLALVAAGLITKMLYDRGKRIEAERRENALSSAATPRP